MYIQHQIAWRYEYLQLIIIFLTQVVNRTSGLNGLFLSDGKIDDDKSEISLIVSMADHITLLQQVAVES